MANGMCTYKATLDKGIVGFKIVGTLPKAFNHIKLGYVDAYVMHRFLD